MWTSLPPLPSNKSPIAISGRPVRIAVIDTGVAIEASILEDLYENRLKECRSWTCANPARLVDGTTADTVGHGTHAASLLLKVTENTDCEIYVARVFEDDPQQTNGFETMANPIAQVGCCDGYYMAVSSSLTISGDRICGATLGSRHNIPFLRHRSRR
jgi:subtilisin family serine protease